MTEVWTLDVRNPDPALIARAAAILREGRLVAFPTETVYGLGASARDANAVRAIFEAKGRPASNPVIVHVASAEDLKEVVDFLSDVARQLMQQFWPGPLTLVLPRHPSIPKIISAGGSTVAVRSPRHPVARALLQAAGLPIAAPSANRSTELSPTRAEHVLKSLSGKVEVILDGGPCQGGIESTVLDLTSPTPRILRPGLITPAMLEPILGQVEIGGIETGEIARSPGLMVKHYSPRTPLELVAPDAIARRSAELNTSGRRFACLTIHGESTMPADPERYAAELYSRLHQLDEQNLDCILVEMVPPRPEWLAVRDRLLRAAANMPENSSTPTQRSGS